jgi:CheY-like chemotaxis protein
MTGSRDEERELSGPCPRASAYSMKKVLVADDNDSAREFLRAALKQMCCLVWEARDGPEAVLTVWRVLPDLVFLDLHMPRIDGFGALREIRRYPEFRRIPIIALTVGDMTGACDRALAAGFTSCLTKPVSLQTLRREVEESFA